MEWYCNCFSVSIFGLECASEHRRTSGGIWLSHDHVDSKYQVFLIIYMCVDPAEKGIVPGWCLMTTAFLLSPPTGCAQTLWLVWYSSERYTWSDPNQMVLSKQNLSPRWFHRKKFERWVSAELEKEAGNRLQQEPQGKELQQLRAGSHPSPETWKKMGSNHPLQETFS